MKKIIDISWPISQATTGYKDKNVVEFREIKHFAKDGARETAFCLSSHTGTHVDAPAHFMKDGATIDQLDLKTLVGDCRVLDVTSALEKITGEVLEDHKIESGDIVLLKTANSLKTATEKFTPHFVYLDVTGADYLVSKKVKGVGIDYLGMEHSQHGHPTHITLMKKNITIIEGLRLGNVKAGEYMLVCLPLLMIGLEAAPARAVLIEE